MREIGGYFEYERYSMPMLHEKAIAVNCGRNALAYLIKSKNIKKIRLPKFLCDSVREVCEKENTAIEYYSITKDFLPVDMKLDDDEWLYVVNFYGQLDNNVIKALAEKYKRVIADNAQAYFQMPVDGVDTVYTCRKFFGVSDGGLLYTDGNRLSGLIRDESHERMGFVLGRFERSASEFYAQASANNDFFADEPVKLMSPLTENILHSVDYDKIKKRRTDNFTILHNALSELNPLKLTIPEGAFMYPFYAKNGYEIRKTLQAKKIFIPTLWPDVFDHCCESDLEYDYAKNILPLPVDQRYGGEEMELMVEEIMKCLKN